MLERITGLAAVGVAFAAGFVLHARAEPVPLTRGAGQVQEEEVALVDDYESLVDEYKKAVKAHRDRIRESDSKDERRELRKNHPARAFSERFESLAISGEGAAYLWLIQRAKDRGVERSEMHGEKAGLYERFFRASSGGELLEEGVQQLLRDSTFRKGEGLKEADRLFALALEMAPTESDQISLRVISAFRLAQSKEEVSQERGLALLRELAEKHPDHERMEAVKKKLFALEHLAIGKIAPEFEGATIDGAPIKLSDYRGKVVVLDFFGFW